MKVIKSTVNLGSACYQSVQDARVQTGFIWLRVGRRGGSLCTR